MPDILLILLQMQGDDSFMSISNLFQINLYSLSVGFDPQLFGTAQGEGHADFDIFGFEGDIW